MKSCNKLLIICNSLQFWQVDKSVFGVNILRPLINLRFQHFRTMTQTFSKGGGGEGKKGGKLKERGGVEKAQAPEEETSLC